MPQVALFFQGLAAGFAGNAVSVAVAGALGGAAATGAAIGTFFGSSVLGSILLNVGASALIAALNRPRARGVDEARVNTRLPAALRWQAGGSVMIGGEVGVFGEHDASGAFWFIVAHCDNEMTDPAAARYFLDGIEVTLSDGLDGFLAGQVLTDDFCLTEGWAQYTGSGTRYPYFRLFTVTPDSSSVYGALPSEFTTAFPELPADFLLAGVCYTIVQCGAVPPEHYGKVMRWRGAFGLGEPAVTVYANFARMYDPREAGHDIDDPDTWTASDGNPAIVWAWWRTQPFGRGKALADIAWDAVADAADQCDETVLDRSGAPIPRYRCGVAFRDDAQRQQCEAEILATADAFVAYDDEGRAYPVIGLYEAATVDFSAARDILSAKTQAVDDGEQPLDGVIVEYISPDHGFQRVQAAPWVNEAYYDGVAAPNYQTVPILGVQNHNQAVRLAKAIGRKIGASKRGAFEVGLRGLLAKGQRAIGVDWDSEFTGDFRIISPVEESADGQTFSLAVVPMASDDWTLGVDEEGAPPELAPALDIDNTLEDADGVVISAVQVVLSGGFGVRLEAVFDAPGRVDRFFRFRYAPTGLTTYQYFTTDMDELLAYSALVDDGAEYDVQWQTLTASGRATDWSAIETITATADPTAPPALTAASATGGVGHATVDWTTANSVHQARVAIYRDPTTTKPGSPVAVRLSGANTTDSFIDTPLAPGTWYFWAEPQNASGIAGTDSGPFSVTVT